MVDSDFDLAFQNSNIDSKIVVSLEKISQAFRVLLWEQSKKLNLSPIQIQILIFLLSHKAENCKVSILADEFNMTKPTISEAIKSLEMKNYIRKIKNKEDSRSFVICLTGEGVQIAQFTSSFSSEIRKPVRNLNLHEKENLLLNMMEIISYLNKSGIINIQRMCFNCIFYRSDHEHPHFCNLLNQKLNISDLRIDCPEYFLK